MLMHPVGADRVARKRFAHGKERLGVSSLGSKGRKTYKLREAHNTPPKALPVDFVAP